MKNYSLISSFIFLFSCGSAPDETTEKSSDTTAVVNVNDENIADNTAIDSSQIQTIPLKEKNQVTDYAEHFLGAKVFEDREKMNYENGDMHYYDILDVKNGFARVTGAYEGSYDFAIWRMANGNDLVGKTSMGCGPVCDYDFYFYEIANMESKDVTETILPLSEIKSHLEKIRKKVVEKYIVEDEGAQLLIKLPQKGTSMDIYISMNLNDIEFPILNLSWNKEIFVIAKKIEEIPALEFETR